VVIHSNGAIACLGDADVRLANRHMPSGVVSWILSKYHHAVLVVDEKSSLRISRIEAFGKSAVVAYRESNDLGS
jgi:hypothetical protein